MYPPSRYSSRLDLMFTTIHTGQISCPINTLAKLYTTEYLIVWRTRYFLLLLSARATKWSIPVILTEMENENDSANQNDIAKMTLQK